MIVSTFKMTRVSMKISLVGNSGVGKTSLLTRYVKGIFYPNAIATVGANFLTKELEINDRFIDLNIWDTAGQELYRSLTPMYYRNASAAVVVFDVTTKTSFDSIRNWIFELRTNEPHILIFLCGNKIDDTEKRIINTFEISNLAKELQLKFFETSACTGQGIDQLFQTIVLEILKQEKTIELTESNPEPSTSKTSSMCC